ncbi:MAG: choice-of-anchor F family protein [Thiomicrorhabdus chilensis]|uniref:choice-of-anchor F family protein n=1 Tax=Thiomicrorhabdus chilensis TaxID=63656 RepID=UPI00299DC355|nr:choice-of-anchor F family protein [Thiomicrorhabdus chilensis]MDX1348443.1 choice-of-anchor F family protein [Thiomicrorhabdus chilensis]
MKKTNLFKLSLVAAACMAAMSTAQADTITGIQENDVGTQSQVVQDYDFTSLVQFGFGSWNLDNVSVKIVDAETGEVLAKDFDPNTGIYSAMEVGDSFASFINDGTNIDTPTAKLTGKDWPVGEPSGVKALTDLDAIYMPNGKPASCIMSTSFHPFSDDADYVSDPTTLPEGATIDDGLLNSSVVNPTMCNSAFQTHKRFKVSALPASVEAGGAIDMVFNVQDGANPEGAAATRYMVLQKLNNYTGKHLKGFTLQVGTGIGGDFVASATFAVELSDGVGEKVDKDTGLLTDPPTDIWDATDMATFSAGLFGPGDEKHAVGFFDTVNRAGFLAAEAAAAPKNSIVSGDTIADTYETLFGSKWLPSIYEPKGIFYDFDNDPATDDRLVAWWGDNPNTDAEDYMWLKGAADNYAPATADELEAWAESSDPYYIGGIEDVLNLGLSYIIDVGDLTDEGENTFTLRMIPMVDETRADYIPGFVEDDNQPPADLTVYEKSSSNGFSAYDNTSLLASVLAFLGLGALVARRKLSK